MKYNFKQGFWLKATASVLVISIIVSCFAYSVAGVKLEDDIDDLSKRTSLQLNIEKERVISWLTALEHIGLEFVEAEPLRTFVVALANTETLTKNRQFLNDEKVYIQTVLDGFVYQNSLKRASLIAGTGDVFLHSGYNGKLNKKQKRTALEVIAESKLKYLPVKQEGEDLVLEVYKPIYGFVVDDLPVAVLHMAIKLDRAFINLITKNLPVEGSETIKLWQYVDKNIENILYNERTEKLELKTSKFYSLGFNRSENGKNFYNTIKIEDAPLFLTLTSKRDEALSTYNLYLKNLRLIVLLIIASILVFIWGVYSKIIVKKYKQELEYKEKLAQQAEKTVSALVKTLELRDPYLAGHHANVKDFSIKIAQELEMSNDDISTLKYSALLAGIGKIAIPKDILTKPEKLTSEETKIMQSHVSFAEEILEDMDFELPIKEVVSQMYERLDGSGYPRGIAGVDISKLSRILAVCDVFCALRSPRSYRDAKTDQQALEIMQNDIALFDAEVLATIFKIINK